MPGKKVKLAWVANEIARKASLKKRRTEELLKKVSELTTLCGVKVCLIIYSPNETEPVLWPSRTVVEEMFTKYQMDKNKTMACQEGNKKEPTSNNQECVVDNEKVIRQNLMSYLMHKVHSHGNDINSLEFNEKIYLIWLLEEKMQDIRKRRNYLQQAPSPSSTQQPLMPTELSQNTDVSLNGGIEEGSSSKVTHLET